MLASNSGLTGDFHTLLSALSLPRAFPSDAGLAPDGSVDVIQTHASAVLLTQTRAYKLKKPVNLEFLDYSTAERRRRFCLEECDVNQALAPSVYLGVAPVLSSADQSPHFGALFAVPDAPAIGAMFDGSEVIDFAVVMRRLPESDTLASIIERDEATADLMGTIARVTADFHRGSTIDPPLSEADAVEITLARITQTLSQAQADIGVTISSDGYAAIDAYISAFRRVRRNLLVSRASDGWTRDCHGDLRLEHMYAAPSTVAALNRQSDILIVDRIEFDPNFRYGDVASELAFPMVELERAGRSDLARALIRAYVERIGGDDLLEVLPFYQVYRAMVRGRVRSILLSQPGTDSQTRARAQDDAVAMYQLARHHASTPVAPTLALIGGVMGTGKSTLAQDLRRELGWPTHSSDVLRKRLAGMSSTSAVAASDSESVYSPQWNERVQDALVESVRDALSTGHSAILDTTFTRRDLRARMARLASSMNARAVFLECVCPRDVALSRLETRWSAKTSGQRISEENVAIFASDGRPELYDQQVARWEPYDPQMESNLAHTVIDTTRSMPQQVELTLDALKIPRLACWLA